MDSPPMAPGAPLITLDTSGILALLDRKDPQHQSAASALNEDPGPYLVPCETLGEVGYFLEHQGGQSGLDAFLDDLESGHFTFDCGSDRVSRVRQLAARYSDLPLGLVDSAVIACAEANGGRVLALDWRHFGVVAREGTITVVPES
jgi:predicted nucleic acid-binding protein